MEKHILLAKKLKALSDKGIGGEKLNAEKMLQDLLKKFNIKMSDIEGEEKFDYFFKLKENEIDLWIQIVKNVNWEIKIYGEFPKKKIKELALEGNYMITCAVCEYIEIEAKYKFYSDAYKQELEIFYSGFIHANQLYSSEPPTKKVSELSEKEKEEYQRTLLMASNIKKQSFHKQLK